jgi:hypothetical protein
MKVILANIIVVNMVNVSLCSITLNEEDSYVGGWVGEKRNSGYST